MKIIKQEIYKFSELSEKTKEKVLEKNRNINVEFTDWYDSIKEFYIEAGKLIGIDIDKIYFSGFSSQGDGACFEGNYEYKKGGLKKLKKEFPKETKLHEIAGKLQKEQRKFFYELYADVKHRGHYYHENCTDINVYKNSELIENEEIVELLRYFMQEIYSGLEKEFEYQTSDKVVKESLEINEYEFYKNGSIYIGE